MDIVSVAAPKRRRRRKQEAEMADPENNPAIDPLLIVETPLNDPTVLEVVEGPSADEAAHIAEEPKCRDIGNWRYTPWKGKPMWTNSGNSAWTSFDEKYVRKHRHRTGDPDAIERN